MFIMMPLPQNHNNDQHSHYPSTKNHRHEQPGQTKQQSNNKVMGDEGEMEHGGMRGKQCECKGGMSSMNGSWGEAREGWAREGQAVWDKQCGTSKGGTSKGGTSSTGPKRHLGHLLGHRFLIFVHI